MSVAKTSISDFVRDLEHEIVGRGARIDLPEEGEPVITIGVDFKIIVGALWRLVSDSQIISTREDEGHLFGRPKPFDAYLTANAALLDKTLKTIAFDHRTGDLRLEFSGQVTLEIISTSSGYESWVMWHDGSLFAVGASQGLV